MAGQQRRAVLTITEQARRAQIVRAAIDTIAETDYARASFAAIARRAGLSSTGMISYHFQGKQDLITEVMRTVLADFAAFVVARTAPGTAAEELAGFLLANSEFLREHRHHLVAMLRIQAAAPDSADLAGLAAADRAQLAELLARGQRDGEFREFDTDLMAGFVLSLRNGVITRVAAEPDFDLAACTRELLATVRAATER
ncbi:TetR/AcrR family transcriptional regulator [Nocardia sp. NPDC051833]|uniref:TetR/AcrR family transcriptional regulator n=1 Tax=Nocardia sp. NPDC051833 TaxID=3155674 RepID=UPI0034350AA7